MMLKGNKKIEVGRWPTSFAIHSTGEFHVFTIDRDGKSYLVGPPSSAARFFKFKPAYNTEMIHVEADKDVKWIYHVQELAQPEENSGIPIELPVNAVRPDTVEDMIRKYIRQEFSTIHEEQGYESFDESNDFDIEDEEPDPFSAYEVREMQEEYPPAEPEAAESPESPSQETSAEAPPQDVEDPAKTAPRTPESA